MRLRALLLGVLGVRGFLLQDTPAQARALIIQPCIISGVSQMVCLEGERKLMRFVEKLHLEDC